MPKLVTIFYLFLTNLFNVLNASNINSVSQLLLRVNSWTENYRQTTSAY